MSEYRTDRQVRAIYADIIGRYSAAARTATEAFERMAGESGRTVDTDELGAMAAAMRLLDHQLQARFQVAGRNPAPGVPSTELDAIERDNLLALRRTEDR